MAKNTKKAAVDISELQERPGVVSANRNQHALTVTCDVHADAQALAEELGGEVSRDRLWVVTVRGDDA